MRALMFTALALLVAAPASAVVLRSQERAYPTDDLRRVRVDFPVGELQIEPTDGDQLLVTVFVTCKHRSQESCERSADRIKVRTSDRGDLLSIKIEGVPKFNAGSVQVKCTVKVPRALDLDVDMGVGELTIREIAGNLEVDLGVGEIDVALAENNVRDVRLNVGIGEASFSGSHGNRSVSGLFGRKITWTDGAGASRVNVDLGVGEARVRLD